MDLLQPQVIVHRDLDILLRPKIAFRGLDGGVPEQEFDLLEIPAVLPTQLGAGATESWAPKCSIPICLDDCSTTDQTAQSLRLSRLTFPLFETERSSRPSSMPAAVIQALMPCLTQMGMATVRILFLSSCVTLFGCRMKDMLIWSTSSKGSGECPNSTAASVS
jgi:hypothetical protein